MVSFRVHVFFLRYLLICLPPLVLLAARGLAELRSVWTRSAVAILFAVVTAGSLIWYYPHPKDDWRSLTAYLLSHSHAEDVIAGCPPGAEWPVQYYASAATSNSARFSYVTSALLVQQMRSGRDHPPRFWVVSWGDNPEEQAIAQEVAPDYVRVDEQRFAGYLILTLYARASAVGHASGGPDR